MIHTIRSVKRAAERRCKERPADSAFDHVIVAEYLTFLEVMANADIQLYS